jgi:excisionase family DNA binding protein
MKSEKIRNVPFALRVLRGEVFIECHRKSSKKRRRELKRKILAKAVRRIGRIHYDKVFNLPETAGILRVKNGVVYRAIGSEKLVAQKVGKEYRIHKEALDRYLLEPWLNQEEKPAVPPSITGKMTSVGSSSIADDSAPPESAVEIAKRMLSKS